MNIFFLAFSCVFLQNILLIQFLGICPFLGVTKRVETAFGMGLAVLFVITVSSSLSWVIQTFVLSPFSLEYIQTVIFILIVASLVQIVEIFLKKKIPFLYSSLGIYLPLITTNCAVLGAILLAIQKDYIFLYSLLFSFFISLGFILAMLLMAGVRKKIESDKIPDLLKGVPIVLITGGLLSIAFFAFVGMGGQ